MIQMKNCSNKNCTETNPQLITNFHKDSHTKDGYKCRCKTCLRSYSKKYSDEHKEIRAKKQREYYIKHGYIQRKASNNWKKNNKDRVKEYCHKWYIENKSKKSEWFKKYSIDNKNIILEKSRRQRNKKYGIKGTFSEKDFEIKLYNNKFKCFYCGCELNKDNITRDHYIPLCNGGTDTIDNIVPCCKKCNSMKNNKSPEEFIESMDNHDPSINLND